MHKKTNYLIVFAAIILSACQAKPKTTYFVHETSDLKVEEGIEYGRLPNGVRFAVMANETPTNTASLLMRFDTCLLYTSPSPRD